MGSCIPGGGVKRLRRLALCLLALSLSGCIFVGKSKNGRTYWAEYTTRIEVGGSADEGKAPQSESLAFGFVDTIDEAEKMLSSPNPAYLEGE